MKHTGIRHRLARLVGYRDRIWACRMCEAEWIRETVDGFHSRTLPNGSINPAHVAQESTMRSRTNLPRFIAALDGPGRFAGHERESASPAGES